MSKGSGRLRRREGRGVDSFVIVAARGESRVESGSLAAETVGEHVAEADTLMDGS